MKHRQLVIIFLFTLLATSVAGTAGAQTSEPNYMSRKEQRRRDKEERKKLKHMGRDRYYTTEYDEPEQRPVRKKFTTDYPQTTMKTRYRIDVLMPMYLDDLVKGNAVTYKDRIPEKALPGMSFYEGINIAADSLKKAGFKIDIYIHDIASAAESADMLVSKGKLDSTDLIIGAVPSKDLPVLAEYANNKKVNFVSALTAADGGITGNAYFTMMQPSLKTHCEWIVSNAAQKYPNQKVVLLYRRSVEADSNAWRHTLMSDNIDKIDLKKLSCRTLPTKEKLLKVVDTTKPNVVIVSILDIVYADSVLKLLTTYFPNTHFEIYGMPTWNTMPGMGKKKTYPNLTVNYTSPFVFDAASASGKYLNKTYKRDYSGKPTEMVYRGYEAMFWYANLLKQYGTIFNEKYSDNSVAPFTKFEVKPQWDKNGNILYNENTHVFLSTYEGGVFKTQ